jgi:hypothetical protein
MAIPVFKDPSMENAAVFQENCLIEVFLARNKPWKNNKHNEEHLNEASSIHLDRDSRLQA